MARSTEATYLIRDWMARLLEDSDAEAALYSEVRLLEATGRAAVWSTAAMFGCEEHGVPAQACRLLERYLYLYLRDYNGMRLDVETRTEIKNSLLCRLPLLMASSVQLAAKMSNTTTHINATVLRIGLLCKKLSYTIEEINTSEFEVFKVLGFQMPLWTSTEISMFLARQVDVPSAGRDAVAHTINLAEFHRDKVQQRVRWAANLTPCADESDDKSQSIVRTLHLCAGAVAASTTILGLDDVTSPLASLIRAPRPFVTCLRDVILENTLSSSPRPTTLKRRLPSQTIKPECMV